MNEKAPKLYDFYEVLKIVQTINKFLGITAWTLQGKIGTVERKYITTKLDNLWRIAILASLIIMTLLYFYYCPIDVEKMDNISHALLKYVHLIIILSYLYFAQINRHKMLNITEKIHVMDKEMEKIANQKMEYRTIRNYSILCLTIMYFIAAFDLSFCVIRCGVHCDGLCPYLEYLLHFILIHIDAFLLIILYYLKRRVATLNDNLKRNLHEKYDNKLISIKLTQVKQTYGRIIDICNDINRAFEEILLFKILLCSLFTLAVGFLFSNLSSGPQVLIINYVDMAFWIAVNVFEIIVVIYHFVSLKDEARKTVELMENVQSTVGRSHLAYKQVDLFSLQVYVEDFKFTVFGFFPLDWTLLHSMIAGIATYLIIFHQFNNMKKN